MIAFFRFDAWWALRDGGYTTKQTTVAYATKLIANHASEQSRKLLALVRTG